MASIYSQKTLTGNLILLKIKGQTVGRAQSIDPNTSYGTERVYELGTIMPQEDVHLKYDGKLTLERFMLRNENLVNAGYVGLGEDILKKDIIDIEVIDSSNNKTIRVYRGCTFTDYTNTFRANAIAGENATVFYLTCDQGE